MTVNPDTPAPRCLILRPDQQVKVVNRTADFGQRGVQVVAFLGPLSSDRLGPGESFTFGPVGNELSPGYHLLKLNVGGLRWTTELLLPKMPCDPGFGTPKPRKSCPDPDPETGWLTIHRSGQLLFEPFRTLHSDAEGRAYAKAHDLEFPFSNDYYDASIGNPAPIMIGRDTICTGIIAVGYREPLQDHVVPCGKVYKAARVHRITVAVWWHEANMVQLSELYRP